MFSIKKKDGLARIGTLSTKHGIIHTPILLPVINPNKQNIHPKEMTELGAEAFITNAYLLYRDPVNKEKVLNEGLHEFFDYKGPIMTDSGAFQLMEYGQVSITNQEITRFQEHIGSDIGVFLDIPTKSKHYEEVKQNLEVTLKRANEHIDCRNPLSEVLWAGPIQGGIFLDLIKKSSLEMKQKDFSVHPIGSVVPLLEKYDFENVIRILLTTKKYLPLNRPIHLFGAGHPIFFAIAVFLGVDIFDSAAYILYANKNRYITVYGTNYLENLNYLPCSCIVCREYSADELKKLDRETRIKLLATHNLIVSFEEIRRIKQAIVEGRLRELVLSRVMSHPSLARSLDLLFGLTTSQFIEQYELISKPRALFISHPILSLQPLIQRYKKRLFDRFYSWNSNLVIAQNYQRIRSSGSFQVIKISPIFGIIPDELRGVYPLVQHEKIPMSYSSDLIEYIIYFLKKYQSDYKSIEVHPGMKLDIDLFKNFNTFEQTKKKDKLDDLHRLNAILDYQFGKDSHKILSNFSLTLERSPKTGMLRHFSDEAGLLGTFRPNDFHIVPTDTLAKLLHSYLPYPRLRVEAAKDSVPFVVQKKDLLAKFVQSVDLEIRCGEEVLIVDEADNFLSFGKSVLSASEMIDFDRGVAVRVRS